MALTGISFARENYLISRKDPAYSERAMEDIDYAREMKATIFWWKALPNAAVTRIQDMQATSSMTMGDMTTQTFNNRTAQRNREVFRLAVYKIENYADEEGDPIVAMLTNSFEPGAGDVKALHEDTMNSIHSSLVGEIGAEIFNRCSMGEDERKKFAAVLSQFDGSDTSSAENAQDDNDSNEDAIDQQSLARMTQTAKSISTGKTPRRTKSKPAAPDA